MRRIPEYGDSLWSRHREAGINLIKNIQRRATWLIPEVNNSSYEEGLEFFNLLTLKYCWFQDDIIQTYKLLHGMDESSGGIFELKIQLLEVTGYHWKPKHQILWEELSSVFVFHASGTVYPGALLIYTI